MRRARGGTGRAGFTMVELLMVVAIIAVVAALLVAGVSRVMQVQARTETQSDITQMTQALNAAKTAYGHIECVPDRLILYPSPGMYLTNNDPLTKSTANVFRYLFGKRFISDVPIALNWGISVPPKGLIISGPECLAFYLGGIPDVSGGPGYFRFLGFAKDPRNPTARPDSAEGKERIGPFYQFKSGRLAVSPYSGFPIFQDPYGTPYAFFSALSPNNYSNLDACLKLDGLNFYQSPPASAPNTEFAFMNGPYREPATSSSVVRFFNPGSFQIISAGRDKKFGKGGIWNQKTGTPENDLTGYVEDNFSNFSQTAMGEQ